MSTEVFPYPTVKQVAFEIRFPHLFSIENRIADFQDKIITQFPNSELVFRRHVVFADTGLEGKLESIPDKKGIEPDTVRKIWVFKSKERIQVQVQTNSISVISQQHQTYNNPNSEKKFRDVIEFVVGNFIKTINLPIVSRVGLRYTDECPLPSKDNETIERLYASTFPISRFQMKDANTYYFSIETMRKNHRLLYQEGLAKNEKGQEILLLDFDGFEIDVASTDFLKVADELHEIIEEEYFSIIREPIKQYMRTGKLP